MQSPVFNSLHQKDNKQTNKRERIGEGGKEKKEMEEEEEKRIKRRGRGGNRQGGQRKEGEGEVG